MKHFVPFPGVRSNHGLTGVVKALVSSAPQTHALPHPQWPGGSSDAVASALATAATEGEALHAAPARAARLGSPHPAVATGESPGSANNAGLGASVSRRAGEAGDCSARAAALVPVPTGVARTQAPLVASSPLVPLTHPAPVSSGSQLRTAVSLKASPTVARPMWRVSVMGTYPGRRTSTR